MFGGHPPPSHPQLQPWPLMMPMDSGISSTGSGGPAPHAQAPPGPHPMPTPAHTPTAAAGAPQLPMMMPVMPVAAPSTSTLKRVVQVRPIRPGLDPSRRSVVSLQGDPDECVGHSEGTQVLLEHPQTKSIEVFDYNSCYYYQGGRESPLFADMAAYAASNALNRYYGTGIVTYGPVASGKSYTLLGSDSTMGLVLATVDHLLMGLGKLASGPAPLPRMPGSEVRPVTSTSSTIELAVFQYRDNRVFDLGAREVKPLKDNDLRLIKWQPVLSIMACRDLLMAALRARRNMNRICGHKSAHLMISVRLATVSVILDPENRLTEEQKTSTQQCTIDFLLLADSGCLLRHPGFSRSETIFLRDSFLAVRDCMNAVERGERLGIPWANSPVMHYFKDRWESSRYRFVLLGTISACSTSYEGSRKALMFTSRGQMDPNDFPVDEQLLAAELQLLYQYTAQLTQLLHGREHQLFPPGFTTNTRPLAPPNLANPPIGDTGRIEELRRRTTELATHVTTAQHYIGLASGSGSPTAAGATPAKPGATPSVGDGAGNGSGGNSGATTPTSGAYPQQPMPSLAQRLLQHGSQLDASQPSTGFDPVRYQALLEHEEQSQKMQQLQFLQRFSTLSPRGQLPALAGFFASTPSASATAAAAAAAASSSSPTNLTSLQSGSSQFGPNSQQPHQQPPQPQHPLADAAAQPSPNSVAALLQQAGGSSGSGIFHFGFGMATSPMAPSLGMRGSGGGVDPVTGQLMGPGSPPSPGLSGFPLLDGPPSSPPGTLYSASDLSPPQSQSPPPLLPLLRHSSGGGSQPGSPDLDSKKLTPPLSPGAELDIDRLSSGGMSEDDVLAQRISADRQARRGGRGLGSPTQQTRSAAAVDANADAADGLFAPGLEGSGGNFEGKDAEGPGEHRKAGGNGPDLLLVEDVIVSQRIQQAALARGPDSFKVLVASRGEEAIPLYQQYAASIRVILMDIGLPGISGIETARRIRQLEREAGVTEPCMIMGLTASVGEENLEGMRRAGMNGCILKGLLLTISVRTAVEWLEDDPTLWIDFTDGSRLEALGDAEQNGSSPRLDAIRADLKRRAKRTRLAKAKRLAREGIQSGVVDAENIAAAAGVDEEEAEAAIAAVEDGIPGDLIPGLLEDNASDTSEPAVTSTGDSDWDDDDDEGDHAGESDDEDHTGHGLGSETAGDLAGSPQDAQQQHQSGGQLVGPDGTPASGSASSPDLRPQSPVAPRSPTLSTRSPFHLHGTPPGSPVPQSPGRRLRPSEYSASRPGLVLRPKQIEPLVPFQVLPLILEDPPTAEQPPQGQQQGQQQPPEQPEAASQELQDQQHPSQLEQQPESQSQSQSQPSSQSSQPEDENQDAVDMQQQHVERSSSLSGGSEDGSDETSSVDLGGGDADSDTSGPRPGSSGSSRTSRKSKRTARELLLVEDVRVSAKVAKASLARAGYGVILATTGEAAVSKFRDHHKEIKLVLMDIGLPGIGGVEATKQIRAYERKYRLNPSIILGLTANVDTENLELYRRSGMDGCMLKGRDLIPNMVKALQSLYREPLKFVRLTGTEADDQPQQE